jgi:hypothetical protein
MEELLSGGQLDTSKARVNPQAKEGKLKEGLVPCRLTVEPLK